MLLYRNLPPRNVCSRVYSNANNSAALACRHLTLNDRDRNLDRLLLVRVDDRTALERLVILDLVLDHHQRFEQRVRAWRAADDIHIDRQKLVDALHDRIGPIDTA